eukprot:gene13801-19714_t
MMSSSLIFLLESLLVTSKREPCWTDPFSGISMHSAPVSDTRKWFADSKEGVVPRSSSRASSLAHPKAPSPPESSKLSTLHPGAHASSNDKARAYAAGAKAVPWPSKLGSWTMGVSSPPY